MATEDPFYVGYLPLPKSLKRFVMLFAGIWMLGMVGLAALIASNQQDPGSGVSETSSTQLVEGYLTVDPYPLLHVPDPDSPSGTRSILLVSAFKFGASDRVAEFADQSVEVTGHFIRRDGRAIFELVKGEAIRGTNKEPTAPRITKMGGMPPEIQRTAQARCVFPNPGFMTPRKHLESVISPTSDTFPLAVILGAVCSLSVARIASPLSNSKAARP
jgi:hypothetical protein